MRVRGVIVVLILMIVSGLATEMYAQTANRTWSSLRLRKQLTPDTRIDLRPIMRHNDFKEYRNTSIDISMHHKLKNGWSVQFLSRTFIIPEAQDVQFLWADIAYVLKNSRIAFTNRIRMHYALDLGGVPQRDFIRYHASLTPTVTWKVKPIFAIEPWFQLNGINKLTRNRYNVGLLFPKWNHYNFVLLYMRQDSANTTPKTNENLWVATLTYNL